MLDFRWDDGDAAVDDLDVDSLADAEAGSVQPTGLFVRFRGRHVGSGADYKGICV
jgi:hypothetical protein